MIPLILAPAALVAAPQQPAIQGPTVEGQVLDQAGKPLPASLGLVPMFRRDELFPAKTVENAIPKGKKGKPGFRVPIPAPGLYLLDIRARGCQPVRIPVLLGEEGLKDLVLTPVPEKPKGEPKALTEDPKIAKLAALYAAQTGREAAYRKAIKERTAQKAGGTETTKGAPLDWSADLEAVSTGLKAETDPDLLAFTAVCYLELGKMMAPLDAETTALALDQLPATSPWWAFNPQVAGGAYTISGRSADWGTFREALSKDNPDPEVRAYALFSRLSSAYQKGDKEQFDALSATLASDYKSTKFAKSARTFDPAKMPAPVQPAPALPPTPEAP